jgi:hypothetical protein
MIFHISYISRSTEKMNLDQLSILEAEASSKNLGHGITGFLVYDGFHFFQYIEGDKEAIENLYAKIEQDDRHASVTQLSCGDVPHRLLPGWSMKSFMPSDFVAEDRVHIMDILSHKHEKESIPEIVQSLQFASA